MARTNIKRSARRLLVVAAVVSLLGHVSIAAGANVDPDLIRTIWRAIDRSAYSTVFDHVAIEVADDGTVVMSGNVTSGATRADLANRVAAVDGVKHVKNEITVLPVSRFDTELRYQIARSIYGSSTFWHYAARRHPPIHIIVSRGHVTLAGQVDSEAQRAMAGILASNSAALSLTNELRLPGETLGQ